MKKIVQLHQEICAAQERAQSRVVQAAIDLVLHDDPEVVLEGEARQLFETLSYGVYNLIDVRDIHDAFGKDRPTEATEVKQEREEGE